MHMRCLSFARPWWRTGTRFLSAVPRSGMVGAINRRGRFRRRSRPRAPRPVLPTIAVNHHVVLMGNETYPPVRVLIRIELPTSPEADYDDLHEAMRGAGTPHDPGRERPIVASPACRLHEAEQANCHGPSRQVVALAKSVHPGPGSWLTWRPAPPGGGFVR